MSSRRPVISLFSGAGGLDLGVERCAEPPLKQDATPGPFRVAVATDYDGPSLDTLGRNMPDTTTLLADIREVSTSDLLSAAGVGVGDAALVVGGPPCTPFSKSGFWLAEKRESRDPNASLLDEYVRVVAEARPEAFILENVQGLTYKTHATQFNRLIEQLSALGYNPAWKVLIAAEHGVPQLRRRVFVVGRRDGQRLELPAPTHSGWSERQHLADPSLEPFVSAGEAIKDLEDAEPEAGEIVEGQFGDLAAEVPPGENYLWHTDRKGGRPVFKWRSRYWTFLLRLDPNRPSTTVQAQPGPYVGPFHWQNVTDAQGRVRARRLRVPEIKRLQTFPDSFEFDCGRVEAQRQLGNAVPVELGKAVVRCVAEQLGYLEPLDHAPQHLG